MTKYRAPSIQTAAKILALLKDDREQGKTFSEICRGVAIPKSTGFNILKTLQEVNFIGFDPDTKRYTLGWGLVQLGGAAADRLGYLSVTRPYLRAFTLETGLTCLVVQRSGDRYVIVERMDASSGVRITAPVGESYPLCFGAQGKVFLADLPDSELDGFLTPDTLRPYTPFSITEPQAYKEELGNVRRMGWACSSEEAVSGVRCIAAPVYSPNGGLALVISALGFTSAFTADRIDEFGSRLKEIAEKISDAIAGRRESKVSM